MLWFFESFFPVAWIAFLIYWRIKAAGEGQSSYWSCPTVYLSVCGVIYPRLKPYSSQLPSFPVTDPWEIAAGRKPG